jgi:hypothetical protein
MRRTWVVFALLGGLLATACGDNSRVSNGAATADTAVGTPDTAAAETITSDSSAGAPTEATVVLESVAAVPGDTTQPATAGPLGGVTINDPLPPQPDAATDPVSAETAVRFAYQHWILVDLDKNLRASLIENGESNVDVIDAGLQEARSIIEFGRIQVETVHFLAADRADVTFHVQWQDGPSPYFPDLIAGTALFQGGTWRISGHTLCLLAFGSGQDCAGSDTPVPTPAAALVLLGAPVQFAWLGDTGPRNGVSVPGMSQWDGAGAGRFSISTEVLAGVAALEPADADALLTTRRYLGPGSRSFPIGGRTGRIIENGSDVTLVYIRPDDIVVRIDAGGLTASQVAALAFALAPASLPSA